MFRDEAATYQRFLETASAASHFQWKGEMEPLAKLSDEFERFGDQLEAKISTDELEIFLREVFEHSFPDDAQYYENPDYCTLKALTEEVRNAYDTLWGASHGNKNGHTRSKALSLCAGVAVASRNRGRLPVVDYAKQGAPAAPSTPMGRPVLRVIK